MESSILKICTGIHFLVELFDTDDNKKTCRQKDAYPPKGIWLQTSVIYQATVTRKDNPTNATYVGLTENDFKTRHRNYTASFQHKRNYTSGIIIIIPIRYYIYRYNIKRLLKELKNCMEVLTVRSKLSEAPTKKTEA